MKIALRMLVFFLVLTTSGVPESFACDSFSSDDCCTQEQEQEQDQQHHERSACGNECGICIACPLSAAPSWPTTRAVSSGSMTSEPFAEIIDRPASAHVGDIFQPPRA